MERGEVVKKPFLPFSKSDKIHPYLHPFSGLKLSLKGKSMTTKKNSRPRNKKPKGKSKRAGRAREIQTLFPQWVHWTLCLVFAILAVQAFHEKIYAQGGVLTALALISLATSFFSFSLMPWLSSWEKMSVALKPDDKRIQINAPLFLFFFSLVLFWQPLTHPGMVFSGVDMEVIFPYKVYWTESLKEGDPAFWNPYYHLGIPFTGWPLVGAWSPFNLFHFIFPHSYAMTLDYFCHLLLGALGMYYLMGLWGARWPGRLISAMAFAMGAYTFVRLYQGQFVIFSPAAWLPWILYCVERALRDKKILWVALGAAFSALSFFEGHPQTNEYALVAVALYLLGAWLFKGASFKSVFWIGLGLVAGCAVLTAVALLPQMEYVQSTNRWHFNYDDLTVDHYTPLDLSIFVDPFRGSNMGGRSGSEGISSYTEVANFIGFIPLFLFVSSLRFWRRTPRIAWFFLIAVIFTLLAMTNENAVSKVLFDFFYNYFPLFNHHRCLGRLMIVPVFFMSALAGLALTEWEKIVPFLRKKEGMVVLFLLVGLTAVDLWRFDSKMISLTTPDMFISAERLFPKSVLGQVMSDPSHPRIQPQYEIAADITNKIGEVRLWEDTEPEWSGRMIQIINENYDTQDSDLVGLKYVFRPDFFKNPSPRWKPLSDDTVLNTKALPRAFVTGGWRVHGPNDDEIGQIIRKNGIDSSQETFLEDRPNVLTDSHPEFLGAANMALYKNNEVRLEGTISKPGILFLSDVYFPGWKAWLNGTPVPILKANEAFRAVELPQAGPYKVRMVYDPLPLKLGAIVSLIAWLVWVWVVWRKRKALLPA